MTSPTRTRARKNAQSKPAEPKPPTPQEIELAASQENQEYLQAQLGYLQNRVASLRVNINRLQKEIDTLKNAKNT